VDDATREALARIADDLATGFSRGCPVLQGGGESGCLRSRSGVADPPSRRVGVSVARRMTEISHEFRERSSSVAASTARWWMSSGSRRFTCFTVPG
jgi:hypothetical protein